VRVDLTSVDESWNVSLLGKNITDERYLISTNAVVSNTGVPNMGSLWSVNFGYRF
jgi:outer membrane receptor protein involved in Fe transport